MKDDKEYLLGAEEDPESSGEIPIKEEPKEISNKRGSITENKTKPSKEDIDTIRLKRKIMYIIFFIFLLLSLLCIIIENKFFLDKFEYTLNKNKAFTIVIFIFSIIGGLGISILVCYCECIVKNHFSGVLFLIALFAFNNFSILYLKHIKLDYPVFFSSLMTLVGGSLGLVLISFIVKERAINIFVFLALNAVFSLIFGAIAYAFYNTFWPISFSIAAFLISEFNIYSSQYKFFIYNIDKRKKRKKKAILMYSQPFELNISTFKFFVLLISLIIKLFKCCFSKKRAKKTKLNKRKK